MHIDEVAPERGPGAFEEAQQKLFPPLRNKALAQAADALAQGRTELVRSLVSGFLEKKPRDAAALNLMADLARRSQRFDEAEQLVSRCVELAPDGAGYRFNLAVILRRREKFEEALAQTNVLLLRDPRNPLFRDLKAAILSRMERHAEALSLRRDLAAEYPGSADVWVHYGHALRAVGSSAECIAAYHKALELAPTLSGVYLQLADLKTYRFSAAEISQMERQLAMPGRSAEERADLHSALGKAYADEGLHAKAFDHIAKSNALRRLGVDFDAERLTAHRLGCETLFTEAFFRDRLDWGCASRAPIFIVGMPRSGSTLIEQILSSHSAIEGLGERPDLDVAVGRMLSRKEGGRPEHEFWIGGWFEFRKGLIQSFARVVAGLDAPEARSLGEDYLKLTRPRRTTDRPFFTDKGLRNFGYVGLIHLALPNATIIDVRRHPLDCGWSCFKSHFPGGQPFANRLSDIGHHYANYVRLTAHFHKVLPGRVHRVIYENLVADSGAEVRRLFDYLELPFEEQCLRFHENSRIARTLSSQQVQTPLYKSGVDQWLPYEEWLGPLKAALGDTLHQHPSKAYRTNITS